MAFRPSASKKHLNKPGGQLNMNSMMDMVTIILLFLLKTYSTDGALKTTADDLKLPTSYRLIKPSRVATISVSKSTILVGDESVLERSSINQNQRLLAPLASRLRAKAEQEKKVEEYGGEFHGDVLLIIDKETPFDLLVKVIYTSSKSGYDKIKLMVQSTQGVEEF